MATKPIRRFAPLLVLIVSFCAPRATIQAQDYVLGPDSQRQPNVPQGVVTKYSWASQIYPGTTRDYWVYVPAQYRADKPACLLVVQDGGGWIDETGGWRATIVLDNLIQKGDIPVTIGVFINPGVLNALSPGQQNRYDRSYEYDALGDRYARFLLEEILPEVSKHYNISADPNDRAIAGASSGGIAAFNVAWNRPDSFHRVMSFIGSFTNLRGGDEIATLIRKTEPKPLRVFLQDGSADQNIYSGNWFLANQEIYSALQYAGYESNFVTGTEGHNAKQGGAILPDALRWLWKDYPKPVAMPVNDHDRGAYDFLEAGSDWQLVSEGESIVWDLAANKSGEVFFSDIAKNSIDKISLDGKVSAWKKNVREPSSRMIFGPDGRLYVGQPDAHRIVAFAQDGTESIVAQGVNPNDLAVTSHGDIYFTDSSNVSGRVWLVTAKGEKRVVDYSLTFPDGVRTSPDESLLFVSDMRNKWVWSFQIQPDGALGKGVPFYRLETPDDSSDSGAGGVTVDTLGFLYVATTLGVQVCDQPGRVALIINPPPTGGPQPDWLPTSLAFGGPDMQWLYVADRYKVYRRHLKRAGAFGWNLVKPPMPRL